MKLKLKEGLLLALVVVSLNAHSSGMDKVSHVAGSTVISFASYSLLKDTAYPIAYSVGIAAAVGLAGEWHDRNTGHGFSKGDLAADFVGALAGAYLGKRFYYTNRQLTYRQEF